MRLAPFATIFWSRLRPTLPNEAPAIIQFAITELVCVQPAGNDASGAAGRRGAGAAEFLGHASEDGAVAANVAAAPGSISKLIASWEAQVQRLLLPARRSRRNYPPAVKIKMSKLRKRATSTVAGRAQFIGIATRSS